MRLAYDRPSTLSRSSRASVPASSPRQSLRRDCRFDLTDELGWSTLSVGAQRGTALGMAQTSTLMPSVGVGDDRADSFPDRSVARVDDRAPDQRRNHDAGRDRGVVVKRRGLSRLDQLIERVPDRRRAQ